ncbi:hypothetical protein YB2330_005489 [Saitoella coloradoensis]|nr:uncharacterized protein SAICODRAFT_89355 [Saitoella complicata NRRL Y-17804]ODQ55150.1 hypothetical protein SAICODRAFT_89355 [Saitoella complicata NRRL Y-17804]
MSVSKPADVNPYLAAYLNSLATNPLQTKMATSATLSSLQELLASYLAGEKDPVTGSYFSTRVYKMMIYGGCVSAPMGHILVGLLQRAFRGKEGAKWKALQILASNLLVSPVQNSVYLCCMAIIAGARNVEQVIATWRQGFMPVMRVTWLTSPLSILFAQKYLRNELWVPWFNLVSFLLGTYINAQTKKRRRELLAKQAREEEEAKKEL